MAGLAVERCEMPTKSNAIAESFILYDEEGQALNYRARVQDSFLANLDSGDKKGNQAEGR